MDVTDLPVKYDAKYAERIERMTWQRSHHGYARHCWVEDGRLRWKSMHRLVWAWEYGWDRVPRYIDHINGDRMDNRLENLRATTLSLNAHNARRAKKSGGLPQGVSINKGSSLHPYYAMISHRNRLIHLGVFATVDEAQAAYDEARRRIMAYEEAIAVGDDPKPLSIDVKRSRLGRPPKGGACEARALYESGMTVSVIARHMGMSDRTVSRLLKSLGVSLTRGPRPVDKSPPARMMDARPVAPQENRDDYGNNHGECGKDSRTEDVEVGQADDQLLCSLDGEEGRADDVGGCGLL